MEIRGQLYASAALTKRNKTRLPFSRRLGGTQNRSGSFGDPAANHQPLAFSPHRIWPLTRKNCKTLLSYTYMSVYDKTTLKIYTDCSSSSGHAVRPRKCVLLISSKGHPVLPSSDRSPVKACVCVCVCVIVHVCDFYPSNVI
jgi:hypothetical protein